MRRRNPSCRRPWRKSLSQDRAAARWGKQEAEMSTFFQRLFTTKAAKSESHDPKYAEVITCTANMVHASDARALAKKHELQILDLTWEDTGRFKGSCVGPNISDMT